MTSTTKDFCDIQMTYHIHQSNLIESVTSLEEVDESLEAWHRLMEYDQITLNMILELHSKIMYNLMIGHDLGQLRKINVEVNDVGAPHYLQVPDLMNEWINDMQIYDLLDPKAMHVRFEKIHPFRDGNGRVGRMLMWWHEAHLDRIPTLILNVNKLEYYRWFMDRYI